MQAISELPAFQPLVLFSVLLALKMGAVGFLTALRRFGSKVVVNPEDVPVNPGSHAEIEEAPATLRAKRAHLNDIENIPVFLVLALLLTMTGVSSAVGWGYFGLYFVARSLHTTFYLNAIQPWRTAAFAVGQFTQLAMMIQLLFYAL